MTLPPLDRGFYDRPVHDVAVDLLGKVLVGPARASGRIAEVEAYDGANDPASHGHRGPTPRNATMFGPPGHLYVYFTYGMHWCANAVCGPVGHCAAVLIRALEPLTGLDEMRRLRVRARRDTDLTSGPAKLCEALGLERAHNGADLVTNDRRVTIIDDGWGRPEQIGQSTRIGISAGAELPWRYYICDSEHLSVRPVATA